MRALTATAVVSDDHTMTVALPSDIPPGPRIVVIVLDEPTPATRPGAALELAPHPVGPADPACTYRREDLYGDGGR